MASFKTRSLTVPASETIVARARRDPAFVRALLAEAAALEAASELDAASVILHLFKGEMFTVSE